jgi:ABC-type uncharacterized transport system substrate-binding protein
MRRRQFLIVFGGAALAWPHGAHAQRPGKRPTIRFMGNNPAFWRPYVAAFVERLGELGWSDGQTIAIEYRWAEGHSERASEIAAEFVRLNVDVIVTYGDAVPTIKKATMIIPVVFALANNPVGGGLVASLARPGGNVTGLSSQSTDIVGKRLELLHNVALGLRQLIVMFNASYPDAVLEMGEVQDAAHRLGLEVTPLEVRREEDIAPAFAALNTRAGPLYVVADALTAANARSIVAFALSARLPTFFQNRTFVQAGGLMSYGPSFPDMFRRTADLVDKILHGAKPGDIPVEQPTKFEFVINLKTAKALGLTIPDRLLTTADEVIE